jgi:preprotein translocase subunit YajC
MHFLTLLAAEDDAGGGAALLQLAIFLLIPVAMYFLLIRPQRRRVREQQALQSQLEVGDEVITTSGVYGFITGFEDDRIWLEIDEDVQIRIARAAVQGKVNTSATSSSAPPATSTPAREAAETEPAATERDSDGE